MSLETAQLDLTTKERSIVNEVDTLLRQIKSTEESIELLKERLEQARFSFEVESELFKEGLRTSNDRRDAQDDYFETRVAYNVAIFNYQYVLARLFRALGRPLF